MDSNMTNDFSLPSIVRVDRETYEAARSHTTIDGDIIRGVVIPVRVHLGDEKPYKENPNDQLQAENKRIFFNCVLEYAASVEDRDNKVFIKGATKKNLAVKIFY